MERSAPGLKFMRGALGLEKHVRDARLIQALVCDLGPKVHFGHPEC